MLVSLSFAGSHKLIVTLLRKNHDNDKAVADTQFCSERWQVLPVHLLYLQGQGTVSSAGRARIWFEDLDIQEPSDFSVSWSSLRPTLASVLGRNQLCKRHSCQAGAPGR